MFATRTVRNRNFLSLSRITMLTGIIFSLSGIVDAQSWDQWRGPGQSGVSQETGLGDDWTDDNRLWRTELPGPGGSSPIVHDEHIFLTSVDGPGDNGDPVVLACLTRDGEIVWKQTIDDSNQNSRDGATSASPSPATDGTHVWAQSTAGVMHCFTVDGELKWKKDLQEEYGEFKIQFGMTSSAVLDNGRLYFQLIHGEMKRGSRDPSSAWVVCLDGESGDEVWKHLRETEAFFENTHSYATPVVFRNGEQEFLITHGADYAIGHRLTDGEEIWRCGGLNDEARYNPTLRFVSSPAFTEDRILIPSAKSGPVISISASGEGLVSDDDDVVQWRSETTTPDVACPLIYDGIVYLARENGLLICLDLETGEETFKDRMYRTNHRSSPVAADGKIYLTSRDGKLLILKSGSEPELLSTIDLAEDTTASPAISGGRVYIRTESALYAFGNKEGAGQAERDGR